MEIIKESLHAKTTDRGVHVEAKLTSEQTTVEKKVVDSKTEPSDSMVSLNCSGVFPLIEVCLPPELTSTRAAEILQDALGQVELLAGNPFGLLIDTQAVQKADDEALALIQSLEVQAASSGMERLAHVLPQRPGFTQESLAVLDKTYLREGFDGLIRNFFELGAARGFLHDSPVVTS